MATDFYQLRIKGMHETQYNECVLHFRGTNLTAANYVENANDLCNTFNDTWADMWLNLLPQTYQLLRLTGKKASVGGGAEVNAQYDWDAKPGSVAGAAAAEQLCPVIVLIPPMGIKSAGKIFTPCIAESQIAANVPNATWLSNLATMMASMIAGVAFSSITWDLVIYSRKNSSFAEVVDYSTSPVVGFQRRRQRTAL